MSRRFTRVAGTGKKEKDRTKVEGWVPTESRGPPADFFAQTARFCAPFAPTMPVAEIMPLP